MCQARVDWLSCQCVNKHEFMDEFKPLFEGLGHMRADYEDKVQPVK